MSIPRMLAAGALFAIGAVLVSVPACIVANDLENGQDCLKDEECASKQCTAGKCIGQPSGVGAGVDSAVPPGDTGTTDGTPSDAPGETATEAGGDAPTDGGSDSGTDTAVADSGTDTADGAATD